MKYTLENLLQKNKDYKDIDLVWKHFFTLSTIPRPSKHEEKVKEWLINKVKKWQRKYRTDSFGNIVVEVPANKAELATLPTLAIQSHLDMVCEKDSGVKHNFFEDPLQLEVIEINFQGKNTECISAKGTTLGADNGIAVAMAVALADIECSVAHGPLELLFTLDEETGLNGAANLGSNMVKASALINIDNAQEHVLCIGCAGGRDFVAKIPYTTQNLPVEEKLYTYSLKVDGLAGGHSGMEIFDGRGNALKVLERALSLIQKSTDVFYVVDIFGGDKRNAIPRYAEAGVCFYESDFTKISKLLQKLMWSQKKALPPVDEGLEITIEKKLSDQGNLVLGEEAVEHILHTIRMCPHGVIFRKGLGGDDSSLSNNLASIRTEKTHFTVVNNSRFSFTMEEQYVFDIFKSVYKGIKIELNTENTYPAWEAEDDSKLQKLFIQEHNAFFGKPPIVRVVHAGLECGLIKQRVEHKIDLISIGPEIEFLHSPKERLHIESTQNLWKLLSNLCVKV